ncbi:HD domain-containing protein [Patescibacteria group bacterium]|nr:HD domain-containing protein [Patescibacteria group bacterium]
MKTALPKEVKEVVAKLEKAGFEAYVVGGCVRDLFLKKEPNDWDIATSATPEQIQKLFPSNFYENKFFTVTILTNSKDPHVKEIEVTTFRAEFEYADRRRPGRVEYANNLNEDLSRRDFTVNAIALSPKRDLGAPKSRLGELKVYDPFEGQRDLKAKLIRAVGNPKERFKEDALRMMRAVRFVATLGFAIEEKTRKAIQKDASLLKEISAERIRDEFLKLLMGKKAMEGIEELRELGLLKYILPELEQGYGVAQNKHHIYTVWEHNLLALQYAAKNNWSLEVRLASLLHDVGKPKVKRGEGLHSTFYGHEVVGAKMTERILERLKFPKKQTGKIANLVRYHLFYYNVDEVTESSIRRLLRNIGKENVEDLMQVRMADRIGSGVPKAEPYKLRHLRYVIERVQKDPISAKMLKLNGSDVMKLGNLSPGPKVGYLLDVLLAGVLEDPKKNTKKYLEREVKELLPLEEAELLHLSKKAKKEREHVEMKRDEMSKQKYWV